MDEQAIDGVAAAGAGIFFLIYIGIIIICIAGMWSMFSKAGEPGWASIVPIVNIYFLCKIAGKPGWWVILFFIPIVNIVITILVSLGIAENFGKSALFGIMAWLFPFVCYPMLGFGDAEYQG